MVTISIIEVEISALWDYICGRVNDSSNIMTRCDLHSPSNCSYVRRKMCDGKPTKDSTNTTPPQHCLQYRIITSPVYGIENTRPLPIIQHKKVSCVDNVCYRQMCVTGGWKLYHVYRNPATTTGAILYFIARQFHSHFYICKYLILVYSNNIFYYCIANELL